MLRGSALATGLLALSISACGGSQGGLGSPESTIGEYGRAVRANDSRAAYALLSRDARSGVSSSRFRTLMSQNRTELQGQAADLRRSVKKGVVARARVRLSNGESVTAVFHDGKWRIEGGVLDVAALRTPRDAIRSLRHALMRRSLSGIERILARETRDEIEAEVDRFLEETEDELGLDVEIRGHEAFVRTTAGREIRLVLEAGEWHVVDVQ